jgi:hypothetical protein
MGKGDAGPGGASGPASEELWLRRRGRAGGARASLQGFEAAVRVPRGCLLDLAHVVHVHEGIQLGQAWQDQYVVRGDRGHMGPRSLCCCQKA